ncbi:hypothetical protein OUZ56_011812 [Daphnia magna]|uniref:Uncharacterized protein n=1 Tax=Daphnia magna TaxID=35525 RepID=A0ABQ9Z1F3_9CRUS|nr:hypothetical protein OUZ56_011812 [Daphnia magna]
MSTFLASRDKVITILKEGKVALTTGLWTSPNKLAFLEITVSLLNDKFEPIEAIIGFKQMLGEHSGINTGNIFFDTIKLFELQERTSKNRSQPFDKDMWIRWFPHVMNICVHKMLEIISGLLQKLRDNDPLPILDCKTRWSSAFYFVKRAVKLRRAIDEIAKDTDLRRNEMEN